MTVQDVLDDIRKRPGTGEVIPIIDPATEEQITEFTDCGPEAINDAVARAKTTAESGVWSGLPDYDRAKVLWRVADLIDENADVFPMVGPGQSYSGMITGPFIPSRSERESAAKGPARQAAADMF